MNNKLNAFNNCAKKVGFIKYQIRKKERKYKRSYFVMSFPIGFSQNLEIYVSDT